MDIRMIRLALTWRNERGREAPYWSRFRGNALLLGAAYGYENDRSDDRTASRLMHQGPPFVECDLFFLNFYVSLFITQLTLCKGNLDRGVLRVNNSTC